MANTLVNIDKAQAYLEKEIMSVFEDCVATLKEYVESELPSDFPDDWKEKIVQDITMENIIGTPTRVTADVGLFYNTAWETVRAGVMNFGFKETPWHRPGAIVWNDNLDGKRKASDAPAYAIPHFYHSGNHWWDNAVRRLQSYFEIRKRVFEENFNWNEILA